MRKVVAVFTLFLWASGSALASLIVTVPPSTAATWPVGTSFEPGEIAVTTNFLGPFSGMPIEIRGWDFGGSQVSLDGKKCSNSNACLEFTYDLNFSTPTIPLISVSGDAFNDATFLLVNTSTFQINAFGPFFSGNVGHPITEILTASRGNIGKSFVFDLYDSSSTWTYVSDISVGSVPEPSTIYCIAAAGLILFGLSARRRLQQRT